MGTGIALVDSKRCRVDFGSPVADALGSATGGRLGEQNDYEKVTSGEHGEYKTGTSGNKKSTCRVQNGDMAMVRRGRFASTV